MLENLSRRFSGVFQRLRGRGTITEADLNATLRELRMALLEADVALPALKHFMEKIKEKALGQEVLKSLSPGQTIIKIVHDELVDLLSHPSADFQKNKKGPLTCIMLVGLQGGGKTTMCSKLAWLMTHPQIFTTLPWKDPKVLLVSLDTYRPAAQEQLSTLAHRVAASLDKQGEANFSSGGAKVDALPIIEGEKPLIIAKRALEMAKAYDVMIVDTAGRTQLDQPMMKELEELNDLLKPQEILFNADAMAGQDVITTAEHFAKSVPLTGLALSRVDGDSRGGAALSLRYCTGLPIKMMGLGEQPKEVQIFDPRRLAGRILDQGDILELAEKAAQASKNQDPERMMKRLQKGIFTLDDLATQLQLFRQMGLNSILNALPGMAALKDKIPQDQLDSEKTKKQLIQQLAIISSMTPKERRDPKVLNSSRKRRIAQGSGTQVAEINRLLEKHEQMKNMMVALSKGGAGGFLKNIFSRKS